MSSEKRTRSTANPIHESLGVLCSETDMDSQTLRKKVKVDRMSNRCSSLLSPIHARIQSPTQVQTAECDGYSTPPPSPENNDAFTTPIIQRMSLEEISQLHDVRVDWLKGKSAGLKNRIDRHLNNTTAVLSNYF